MDSDQVAAQRAELDQITEESRPIAEAVASYFKELRSKKVPEHPAIELTRDYQAALLDRAGITPCHE